MRVWLLFLALSVSIAVDANHDKNRDSGRAALDYFATSSVSTGNRGSSTSAMYNNKDDNDVVHIVRQYGDGTISQSTQSFPDDDRRNNHVDERRRRGHRRHRGHGRHHGSRIPGNDDDNDNVKVVQFVAKSDDGRSVSQSTQAVSDDGLSVSSSSSSVSSYSRQSAHKNYDSDYNEKGFDNFEQEQSQRQRQQGRGTQSQTQSQSNRGRRRRRRRNRYNGQRPNRRQRRRRNRRRRRRYQFDDPGISSRHLKIVLNDVADYTNIWDDTSDSEYNYGHGGLPYGYHLKYRSLKQKQRNMRNFYPHIPQDNRQNYKDIPISVQVEERMSAKYANDIRALITAYEAMIKRSEDPLFKEWLKKQTDEKQMAFATQKQDWVETLKAVDMMNTWYEELMGVLVPMKRSGQQQQQMATSGGSSGQQQQMMSLSSTGSGGQQQQQMAMSGSSSGQQQQMASSNRGSSGQQQQMMSSSKSSGGQQQQQMMASGSKSSAGQQQQTAASSGSSSGQQQQMASSAQNYNGQQQQMAAFGGQSWGQMQQQMAAAFGGQQQQQQASGGQ